MIKSWDETCLIELNDDLSWFYSIQMCVISMIRKGFYLSINQHLFTERVIKCFDFEFNWFIVNWIGLQVESISVCMIVITIFKQWLVFKEEPILSFEYKKTFVLN